MHMEQVNSGLKSKFELVRADVLATAGVEISIEPGDWATSAEQISAWLVPRTGGRVGIWVLANDSDGEQLVSLADQVQESVTEVLWALGRSATWPACALHPSGHPLKSMSLDGDAWWTCPSTGERQARIGQLGEPAS